MSDPFYNVRDLTPEVSLTRVRQPTAVDVKIERILLAIEVHGRAVAYEEPNRSFIRSLFHTYPSAFWHIKHTVDGCPHDEGCACWDCIEALHLDILRTLARESAREI